MDSTVTDAKVNSILKKVMNTQLDDISIEMMNT